MIVVHHLENSRSQRVLWLLEELGVPYEVRRYERNPQTMLAPPELKALHPLGKSPVVEDGGVIYAETGAIFEHLLAAYDGEGTLTPPTPEGRRRLTYWLHYAEGSAMTPLLMKLVFSVMPQRAPALMRPLVGGVAKAALKGFVDPQLDAHRAYWEGELAASGWFAGPAFSAADVMMSFPLEAAASRGAPGPYSRATDFLARIHARPAYRRALERGGPYAFA